MFNTTLNGLEDSKDLYKVSKLPLDERWKALNNHPVCILSITDIKRDLTDITKRRYKGYHVELSDGFYIDCLISADPICCECEGYTLLLNHDLEDLIGSRLVKPPTCETGDEATVKYAVNIETKNIDIWDTKLSSEDFKFGDTTHEMLEIGFDTNFNFERINLHTNKGTFPIILYNYQNGYYSHDIYVESNLFNINLTNNCV